jgi:acyl-homoserine lactone synthase
MVIVAERTRHPFQTAALRDMFESRKLVFVDLLKWDLPVIDGRYEIDQFDDENAVYIIVTGMGGSHLASARLLPSIRPHILDTLFPDLCAGPIPRGPRVMEVTRFCLALGQRGQERLETRNSLVTALVSYALQSGVTTLTGVAEIKWLQQILAFGWDCMPLGLPREVGGKTLGALRIDIDDETPRKLELNGIYRPDVLERADLLEAA